MAEKTIMSRLRSLALSKQSNLSALERATMLEAATHIELLGSPPRYHVYWGHQHSLSRSFATFDAALHEYKLHAREHRDRVLVGRDSTAPRLLGAGHDGERDGLRDEEREAVEAVS